ncbi:hypothetical protein PO124_11150 [Bacillus licheniformis]|nr:hypothetical protein [Bacillus licheniformis]
MGEAEKRKTPIEGEEIEVNLASDKGFMDDMMTAVVNHTKEAAKAFASGNVSGMTMAAPSYQNRLKEVTDGLKAAAPTIKAPTYLLYLILIRSGYTKKTGNGNRAQRD